MSVTECIEIDLENARTFRVTLAEGTTCSRTFRVTVDNSSDTETSVFFGAQSASPSPLPAPLAFFPGSGSARAYQYNISRDKSSALVAAWLIVVDYKTIFNQQELDRNESADPTQRPAEISGQSRTVMRPVRRMLRTEAYQNYSPGLSYSVRKAANSARDMLDPPLEVPVVEWELHWRKNVRSLPDWFGVGSGYENGVNASDQLVYIRGKAYTFKAGTAMIGNFSFSERKNENEIDFITIGWNVIVKQPRPLAPGESVAPSPWDIEILDAGMRTRKLKRQTNGQSIGVWENIRDFSNQMSVTSPVPFDGSGKPIQIPGTELIRESDLWFYLYRPHGNHVDFSVINWT